MTRVLHIVAGNLYGGIETILASLARHRQLCPEMEPEFALCFEGRLAEELRAENVPVHILGAVRFSRPWSVWSARRELLKVLRARKIDAAVCHAAWTHAVFAGTVRKTPAKLVFWLHTPSNGKHWTEKRAGKISPDLAIAVSRDSGAHMCNTFPNLPYEILYTPMPRIVQEPDSTKKRQLRENWGVKTGEKIIVQVSRMEAWKGHQVLIAALAAIKDNSEWKGWFIGGAQCSDEEVYFNELKNLAKRLGINERLQFWGQRSDVQEMLFASDIYCQPNLSAEGLGLVFVEAGLARLPSVTSALGGALEIVDDTSGVLTQPGDVQDVAAALRTLLADAALRKRLGDRAHQKVWSLCDPRTQLRRLHQLVVSPVAKGSLQ